MARFFTHYWTTDTCDLQYADGYSDQPFHHTAGSGFTKKGVSVGDAVYAVNVMSGDMFLIGKMEVGQVVLSLEEAMDILGDGIWEAPQHLIGKEGTETPMFFTRQLPWDIVRQLRFIDPDGGEKELKFLTDENLDRQTLRGIRELTRASAELLDTFLAQPFDEVEYLEDDDEDDDDEDEDDEDPKDIPEAEQEKIVAQFGDAEHNAKVERAAVELVTQSFESEGWKVVSREQDRCGYDLHCTRDDEEYHVEVKGTSGEDVRFLMTEKEFTTAMDDDDYLVCVVTETLSDEPVVSMFDADDLLEDFRYQPLRWAFMLDEGDEE